MSTSNVLPFISPTQELEQVFQIEISDDSLIDSGIRSGDAVWFRRTARFRDGDIVAVQTPDGLFVKFIYTATGCVRLEGAHPNCQTRNYHSRDVDVLGVLVSV